MLHLILSVGKLYSALRSATEKVVSLHMRLERLQTGNVEDSCRSSVVEGLHQWEDSKLWELAVVVVEPRLWKLWGPLAPAEERGEQEDGDGAGSHPGSD